MCQSKMMNPFDSWSLNFTTQMTGMMFIQKFFTKLLNHEKQYLTSSKLGCTIGTYQQKCSRIELKPNDNLIAIPYSAKGPWNNS